MCLAIPGKIVEIDGEKAIADFHGVKKEINITLVPVKIGDYVMVHAGFAIEKIYPEDSRVNPPTV
jgi:hydrogenase expression/formation protein HypC